MRFRMESSGRYEIRAEGTLEERWHDRLGGMAVTVEPGGEVVLEGLLEDQAALSGVLDALNRLQLSVVSVRLIEE